jgi:hypothetical protein
MFCVITVCSTLSYQSIRCTDDLCFKKQVWSQIIGIVGEEARGEQFYVLCTSLSVFILFT